MGYKNILTVEKIKMDELDYIKMIVVHHKITLRIKSPSNGRKSCNKNIQKIFVYSLYKELLSIQRKR